MKVKPVLFLVLLLPFFSNAQNRVSWEGGLFTGVANYSGDVNPTDSPRFQDTRPAVGLVGRIPLNTMFNLRSSMIYGRLIGDDRNYPERDFRRFDFKTNLFEVNMVVEIEPFARDRFYTDAQGNLNLDPLISPYIFGGVGFGFAALNTDYSGYSGANKTYLSRIAQDRNAGSSKTLFVAPVGLGIKFDVSRQFALSVEAGVRVTFSDYLDGISASGDPEQDDIYYFSGLSCFYRFWQ